MQSLVLLTPLRCGPVRQLEVWASTHAIVGTTTRAADASQVWARTSARGVGLGTQNTEHTELDCWEYVGSWLNRPCSRGGTEMALGFRPSRRPGVGTVA